MTIGFKIIFTILFAAMTLLGLASACELVPAHLGGLSAGGFGVFAWKEVRDMLLQRTQSIIMNEERNELNDPSGSLWRAEYPAGQGRVKTTDLFVWACVNTKTGEVEMEVQSFDDELNENLVEGWEWRRFRLIEANVERTYE